MSYDKLKLILTNSRLALRQHRDQIGDYRCWVDDEVLYSKTLPELMGKAMQVPDREEFHRRCVLYFERRQAPDESVDMKIPLDSRVAPLNLTYDSAVLDADIESFTLHDLENEVDRILGAIRVHRLIGYDQRTYEDDRTLYLHLPEKTLAITRLPSRELFLGRGCPDYNNHCQKNPQDFVTGMWNK